MGTFSRKKISYALFISVTTCARKMERILLINWLIILINLVDGYPNGAPTAACREMTPHHRHFTPHTKGSPVTLSVDKTKITPDDNIRVTLEIPEKDQGHHHHDYFKGFLIQARDLNGEEIIGTWKPMDIDGHPNAKTIQCTNIDDSLTHNRARKIKKLSIFWFPPPNFRGKVRFHYTIVHKFTTFWKEISPLEIVVHGDPEAQAQEREKRDMNKFLKDFNKVFKTNRHRPIPPKDMDKFVEVFNKLFSFK